METVFSYDREKEKEDRVCSVCGGDEFRIQSCGHKVCDMCIKVFESSGFYHCPFCPKIRNNPPTGMGAIRLGIDPAFLEFEQKYLFHQLWYMRYVCDYSPSLIIIRKSPVLIIKLHSVSTHFHLLMEKEDTRSTIEATVFNQSFILFDDEELKNSGLLEEIPRLNGTVNDKRYSICGIHNEKDEDVYGIKQGLLYSFGIWTIYFSPKGFCITSTEMGKEGTKLEIIYASIRVNGCPITLNKLKEMKRGYEEMSDDY